jgi:curved DNA-binding protein CbpA
MEDNRKYFDLLELPQDAVIEDVRTNYHYLKDFYSGDSLEMTALNGDFTQELVQDYLSRLDEAYEKLCELLENKKTAVVAQAPSMNEELSQWVKDIDRFSGAALRSIRERLGVDLKDMFAVTRIQTQVLEDIENEVFESIRAEAYLRSYIVEYTRFLSLDTQRVLADYIPRYRSWTAKRQAHSMRDLGTLLTKIA